MKPCRKHDGSSLARAIDWLIDDDMVAGLEQHGNTSWKLVPLITMALCWAWGEDEGLTERFRSGLKVLVRLFPRREWGETYQGFLKSRSRPPRLKLWVEAVEFGAGVVAGESPVDFAVVGVSLVLPRGDLAA